jgi:hypothetical protein
MSHWQQSRGWVSDPQEEVMNEKMEANLQVEENFQSWKTLIEVSRHLLLGAI